MSLKSNLKKTDYDKRLDDIEILDSLPWRTFMVPTPKKTVVKFYNFEESQSSDDESSETQKEKRMMARTTEQWVSGFKILIARRKLQSKSKKTKKSKNKDPKYQFMLGIEFPNSNVIYTKINLKRIDTAMYGICEKYNILLHITKPVRGQTFNGTFLGLYDLGRCDVCNIQLKKIYRCFDCEPKKHGKYSDYCKACYTRREHPGHRSIALYYKEGIFEEFSYLVEDD